MIPVCGSLSGLSVRSKMNQRMLVTLTEKGNSCSLLVSGWSKPSFDILRKNMKLHGLDQKLCWLNHFAQGTAIECLAGGQ